MACTMFGALTTPAARRRVDVVYLPPYDCDGCLSPSNQRKEHPMFTRIVEFTAKHGKTKEVAELIQGKILPILQKQRGFVDEIVLVSTAETNRILGMSFWKNPEDAELYRREQYPKIEELLRPLLE